MLIEAGTPEEVASTAEFVGSTWELNDNYCQGAARYLVDADSATRGGHATVFRAWDRKMSRIVALKVLSRQFATQGAIEAKVAARARDPQVNGVVEVYDVFTAKIPKKYLPQKLLDGIEDTVIVMEYKDPRKFPCLKDLLNHRPLTTSEICILTMSVAETIGRLARMNIFHRDIKPENIFLGRDRHGVITVDLSDFDISSPVTTAITELKYAGTRGYSPPEAENGNHFGEVSEVYCLGATTYTTLTGAHPAFEILVPHTTPDIRENEAAQARFDTQTLERLGRVLGKAMAQNPEDRYPKATEFAAAIITILAAASEKPAPPTRRIPCYLGATEPLREK